MNINRIIRNSNTSIYITGWPLVGNEGINLYIGILGFIPSFPTKGQLDFMRYSNIAGSILPHDMATFREGKVQSNQQKRRVFFLCRMCPKRSFSRPFGYFFFGHFFLILFFSDSRNKISTEPRHRFSFKEFLKHRHSGVPGPGISIQPFPWS